MWFIWHHFQNDSHIFLWQTPVFCYWRHTDLGSMQTAHSPAGSIVAYCFYRAHHVGFSKCSFPVLFGFWSLSNFLESGTHDLLILTPGLVHRRECTCWLSWTEEQVHILLPTHFMDEPLCVVCRHTWSMLQCDPLLQLFCRHHCLNSGMDTWGQRSRSWGHPPVVPLCYM